MLKLMTMRYKIDEKNIRIDLLSPAEKLNSFTECKKLIGISKAI